MANHTDPLAIHAHGFDPQFLIDKITREKIYQCPYWKAECFGLTAETLVDKAAELQYVGGLYGPLKKPTPFICLVLKLLQLSPEKEVVYQYLQQTNFKYLRALAAFYWRLVGNGVLVYQWLEPLYEDFRKLRIRREICYNIIHVDELIDELLTQDDVCDIKLPRLPNRSILIEDKLLGPRRSKLEKELAEDLEKDGFDPSKAIPPQQEGKTAADGANQEQPSKGTGSLRFRDLLVQVNNRLKGRKLMEAEIEEKLQSKKEKEDSSITEWNRLRKELGLKPLS
eukprot:jgi/Galph1/3604/GphlegSOOS_G2245.1